MEKKSSIYFENLDSLRFIAAMLVVLCHFSMLDSILVIPGGEKLKAILGIDGAGGDVGVSFFFVLSGFLITYLMLSEDQASSFSIRNFYIRRVLRIWPLYYFVLLIGFFIYPMLHSAPIIEKANLPMYLLFLSNLDGVYFNPPTVGSLGILWSVCVEEQFYLCWPIIFILVRDRRKMLALLMVVIVLSNAYRISGGQKYHTITSLSDLAIGVLAAYGSFFFLERIKKILDSIGKTSTIFIYIAGIILIGLNYKINRYFPAYAVFDRFIHTIFFAFVIIDQNYSRYSPVKGGSIPLFTHLGRISYGIYMYHIVALMIIVDNFGSLNFYWQFGMALILTILISELSYRFFERYFLNLKEKFARI